MPTSALQETGARKKRSRRLLLIVGVCAYVGCFQWMYINYLYPVFGYYGFDYNPPATKYLALAWGLSLLPSLWMPLTLTRASQLAYWILYITVLIPCMVVPIYAEVGTPAETAVLMVTLFAGFAITGLGYLVPLMPLGSPNISSSFFWKLFASIALGLTVWVYLVFRHTLNIVSFGDVYDVRFGADDLIEGTKVSYALMWLSGAINPFLMAWGFFYKRPWMVVGGVLGQPLIYSSLGTKGSISSVLFISAFYFLLKPGRIPFALKLSWGVALLLGGLCLSYVWAGGSAGPVQSLLLFLILMRTFGTPGLTVAQYYDFFQRNPLTHMSHVSVVNWFIPYPYANFLGLEVGYAYSGDPTYDATANLWAFDGLASFGLPGVLLISVFCALVFWMLDSAAQKHEQRFAALVISYAAYNLANISIFTSLFSGGLFLLIVFLYLAPVRGGGGFAQPALVVAYDRTLPSLG